MSIKGEEGVVCTDVRGGGGCVYSCAYQRGGGSCS